MSQSRRQQLRAVGTAGALTIAGCASGGDGGNGTTTTTTTSTTTTDSKGGAATVDITTHDSLGDIMVDGEGMVLYMFDQDTQGEGASTCYNDCASQWPPLTTSDTPMASDAITAELTTFQRDDGSTQVAANGWPLYYFTPDQSPGEASGQGVGDIWWVLGPDGTPIRGSQQTTTTTASQSAEVNVRSHNELGDILVDGEGMTLYMFDQDTQGSNSSSCSGSCAQSWPPHFTQNGVTAGEGVTSQLSTFDRQDGTTQIAANGWPLYRFAQDSNPGDTNGQGVGDVWWVLAPDGTPRRATGNDTTTTTTDDGGGIY